MCCFYIFETCAVEAGRWILRNTRVLRSTVALASVQTGQHYPEHLRRIRFKKAETGKTLVFLKNQRTLPAATICALHKRRWQVELFFEWIKCRASNALTARPRTRVWTAPRMQVDFWSFSEALRCKSCIRPVGGGRMTAGPGGFLGRVSISGSGSIGACVPAGFPVLGPDAGSKFPARPLRINPSSPSQHVGQRPGAAAGTSSDHGLAPCFAHRDHRCSIGLALREHRGRRPHHQ